MPFLSCVQHFSKCLGDDGCLDYHILNISRLIEKIKPFGVIGTLENVQ